MRFLTGGMQPIGSLLGGLLGAAIGLAQTLAVAEMGMLLAFVWLLCSPVPSVTALPQTPEGDIPAVS